MHNQFPMGNLHKKEHIHTIPHKTLNELVIWLEKFHIDLNYDCYILPKAKFKYDFPRVNIFPLVFLWSVSICYVFMA